MSAPAPGAREDWREGLSWEFRALGLRRQLEHKLPGLLKPGELVRYAALTEHDGPLRRRLRHPRGGVLVVTDGRLLLIEVDYLAADSATATAQAPQPGSIEYCDLCGVETERRRLDSVLVLATAGTTVRLSIRRKGAGLVTELIRRQAGTEALGVLAETQSAAAARTYGELPAAAVRAPAVAAPPHRLDQLSYARLALSSPLVLITRLSPRRYELADRNGAMFGRLIDDLTGDVLAVSHAGAWQCGIRRSWRGWGGVAVDQRSDRVVATYAPRWRKGGALIIGEHEYALRARPGGEHALLDDDGRGVLRLRPVDPEPAGTAFGDDAAVITAAVEVEAQLLDGPDPLMVMLLAIWAADLDREASSRADHSPQGMGL